ncbi:hypothetical protein ULF88_25765 [Halopseudomonas pachastrellae]|nr:hypothetical protein [Halopseudomonas pachastrellae]
MALFSLALVLDALLLLFIVVRTWLDNRNVLKMLLALYVKIPLGVFFLLSSAISSVVSRLPADASLFFGLCC